MINEHRRKRKAAYVAKVITACVAATLIFGAATLTASAEITNPTETTTEVTTTTEYTFIEREEGETYKE